MTMASTRGVWIRYGVTASLLATVLLGHWITPNASHAFHAVHVVLLKLFVLPIVLAAIWFGLRGAMLTAGFATLFYLPLIAVKFSGQWGQAIEHYGEVATILLTAVLAGVLVDRERDALRKLGRVHEGALIALVSALDARERNTRLHSLRVRAFADRIGRKMGLDADALQVLSTGALLHDIGKIGVPDAVLMKPGPLTDEEWMVMRQHPDVGRRILESVPFLNAAAEIVHSHHERFDGTGYPQKLHGDRIPLGARIFSVVDVFDALTTNRPYHDELGVGEAIKVIEEGAGKHFDPAVVRAFVAISPDTWATIAKQVIAESDSPAANDSSRIIG